MLQRVFLKARCKVYIISTFRGWGGGSGGGGVEQVLFLYDIALVGFSDNIPLKWYLSLVVDQQDTRHYKEA